MTDYSKLSNEDLLALKAGDYSKVSNEGLLALKGGEVAAPAPAPSPIGAGEEAMGAVKQALGTMPMAAAASGEIGEAPSNIRRAAMKGVAQVVAGGQPLIAGATSAAAGLASDAMDNPQQAAKAAGIAGQSAIDPVGASKRLMALKPEELKGLAEQAKRSGADFGEGVVAGTVSKMLDSIITGGGFARGQFTGGIESPTTALPGAVPKAGRELGKAKDAAGAFKDYGGMPPSRFKAMSEMITSPKGAVKLANHAKDSLQQGRDMGVTELLILRQAAGQAQEAGGVFAPTYAATKEALTKQLTAKAPQVAEKIANFARVATATGINESQAMFPFLITAINPVVGLARAAAMPWVRNKAGAAVGAALRGAIPAAGVANAAVGNMNNGTTPFQMALDAIRKRRSGQRK